MFHRLLLWEQLVRYKKMKNRRRLKSAITHSKEGFTLIEVLVSISIIGVLMSVLLVALQGGKKAGRDGKRKADIEQIRTALEIYRADCKGYPATLPAVGNQLVGDGTNCSASNVYISAMPGDPLNPTYKYSYSRPTTNSYVLCASLETSSAVHDADCGAAGICGTGLNCNYKAKNP